VPAPLRFDTVEEGDELPTQELFLEKDQVRAYARAAHQWAPRFTDDEGARQEGLPGMITPGNMSLGLIAMMIERWAGIGGLKRLGLTFRGLVMPGRTIRLCGAVTEKHAERRSVELDVWLESPEGERWVIGTATVQLS
jgi:acyl dehydratase